MPFLYVGTSYTNSYLAFWNKAYSKVTQYVSDPTDGDTPVGVDFYSIGEYIANNLNLFGEVLRSI